MLYFPLLCSLKGKCNYQTQIIRYVSSHRERGGNSITFLWGQQVQLKQTSGAKVYRNFSKNPSSPSSSLWRFIEKSFTHHEHPLLTPTLLIMSDSFKYDGINDICAKRGGGKKKELTAKVINASVLSTTSEIHIILDRSGEPVCRGPFCFSHTSSHQGYANA